MAQFLFAGAHSLMEEGSCKWMSAKHSSKCRDKGQPQHAMEIRSSAGEEGCLLEEIAPS